jgi:hypothetical protein
VVQGRLQASTGPFTKSALTGAGVSSGLCLRRLFAHAAYQNIQKAGVAQRHGRYIIIVFHVVSRADGSGVVASEYLLEGLYCRMP